MRISTVYDLSAAIRGHRIDLGLSQAHLAERAGVSRKFVSEVEAGKDTAEVGRVLGLLFALDLTLDVAVPASSLATAPPDLDLDEAIDNYLTQSE